MYGEKGCALVKELHRNPETLPPYNTELVGEVTQEIEQLNEHLSISGEVIGDSTRRVYNAAMQRNLRCLAAYHYNRIRCLRTMRWEFGSILPADIKTNLHRSETTWLSKYSSALAKYMRSIGEDGGVNLTIDLHPPKALFIEVKCLIDYGRYELSDGSVLLLKKNSRHFLPRVECEELIRQGVCEHIVI